MSGPAPEGTITLPEGFQRVYDLHLQKLKELLKPKPKLLLEVFGFLRQCDFQAATLGLQLEVYKIDSMSMEELEKILEDATAAPETNQPLEQVVGREVMARIKDYRQLRFFLQDWNKVMDSAGGLSVVSAAAQSKQFQIRV